MRKILTTMLFATTAVTGVAVAGPKHDHKADGSGSKPLPKCPVMGEPVNLAVSSPTDEGPVYFCCEGCIKKYTKDPANYASAVAEQRKALADRPKIQTTCPVSGKPVDQDVLIDHQGEKVYFCCQQVFLSTALIPRNTPPRWRIATPIRLLAR